MDTVTNPAECADSAENWFLLVDPGWSPESEDTAPPIEAVVGLWPVEEGRFGKFRPNPEYVPADPESPSDPLDAVLRLVLQERAEVEHIRLVLRDSLFDLVVTDDGRPRVIPAPDGRPCVVVATGEPHRRRLGARLWQRVDLAELIELLDDGVDVLFNPAGAASIRLTGDFLRETENLGDEHFAGLYANLRDEPTPGS